MPADAVAARVLSVAADEAGDRLDKLVANFASELSRAHVQRLIEMGAITVNGRQAKAGTRVKAGDEVKIVVPPTQPTALVPTSMSLTVVFEDADILVIDKPAGLVVHPAPGHNADTLVNALVARYPDLHIGPDLRPGIVHRLDKDTSGLMVIAKNDRGMASLAAQMSERAVLKEYLALVDGLLPVQCGMIEAPIGRHPVERKRMAVVPGGRAARSRFDVLETLAGHTLLRVRLHTGRTHQIRVHLASIGHPVEGDSVYGRSNAHCPGLARQFLHAERLGFILPASGEFVTFRSDLPADLAGCLIELRERTG